MDIWMPDVRVAKIAPRIMDKTGQFSSPLSGNVRTITRPGDRWAFKLDYQNLAGMDRARLESVIAFQRGAANRLIYSPGDYVQRGSFPSGELLSNNAFKNGTGGWTNGGSPSTLSVIDRVLYVTATGPNFPQARSAVTVAPYLPYVARAMLVPGRTQVNGAAQLDLQFYDTYNGGTFYNAPNVTAASLLTVAAVAESNTLNHVVYFNGSTGFLAGDYFVCPWTSLAQCFLVDNGANLLLWSDDFTNAVWSKTAATVTAAATAAPEGTTTGQALVDTATNTTHYFQENIAAGSGAADFSVAVAAKAGSQSFLFLTITDVTNSNSVTAYFNLSNGTIGTTAAGASWANARYFISPLGNGWYSCAVVARKTSASTSIGIQCSSANVNGSNAYAGAANAAIYLWRATMAQSSVPSRLVQSVGTAVAAIAQTGSALYVKGLPASTNGLLLAGDWIEVNKELKKVTAALNSDASGLGYLQFSPPLRNSPADNDPVIVNMPIGRFIFSAAESGWDASPPYFANSSLDLVEAL